MVAAPVIELRDLRKVYDGVPALQGLTLTVREGETFGFIGPNGAGKTTTMRILATLLLPTSGEARICGFDVTRQVDEVRRLVGYMPDEFGAYDDLRVWEYLDFSAAAYGVDRRRRPGLIDGVLELTDLGSRRDALVDGLSRGLKQRLCLAKTLVHDPKVLLLDEPASGLDPRARIEIRALLHELRGMGKTVFISSHILSELAELCTTVAIVEQGRLVATGSVEELARRVAPRNRLCLRVLGDGAAQQGALAAVAGLTVHETAGSTVVVSFDGDETAVPDLIGRILAAGVPLVGFQPEDTGLERIFLSMTEGVVT